VTDTGHGPDSSSAPVMTPVDTSVAGEILAGRYQLEEHVSDDSHGRHVWRGIDVVLRRPIAVVLRYPGGAAASEMMSAAVAASRITHPHLVDVYDAIDEGTRAYVVREWVDGASLRELIADGSLDGGRATAVAHAVASAIAAAHATGMAHGNVHPGTVLIADDGRVVLTDARADDSATMEQDVHAVGGVLYAALTGRWPTIELGRDRLPDGLRDLDGTLASPRQVRAGIPTYLSDLAMDLLDPATPPPTAEALAADLGRMDADNGDEFFGDSGPLAFATPIPHSDPDPPRRTGRKLAIGGLALLLVSGTALIVALKLTSNPSTAASTNGHSPASSSQSQPSGTAAGVPPGQIKLNARKVRIVDPPPGDRQNNSGANKTVDSDVNDGWQTHWYTTPAFGNLKSGMGVLIDLGRPTPVVNVKVDFDLPGATVSARIGNSDPGDNSSGDRQIDKTYTTVTGPIKAGASQVLPMDVKTRYVLVWLTRLPPIGNNHYQVTIDNITVNAGP
jgi:hypothetical protein